MIAENTKKIKRIKKIFYFGAGIWAISALASFLIGYDLIGFLTTGLLIIWFISFQFIDFQYISFTVDNGKVTLRYYSVVKFGSKDYHSIEFPQESFYQYRVEKSVLGMAKDLILIIRTKSGIAEYPPVSMAALDKNQQESILRQLRLLMERK
jgi:hypothetical protein